MSKINTPTFRVAFPNVFKPRYNQMSKKDEFSLVALFPKDADLSGLKQACMDAAAKKWGDNQQAWPQGLKWPFRDQGDRAKTNEEGNQVLPDGYVAGNIYLNLRSVNQPGVVDNSVQEIIDSSEFYGGCWARASVSVYAYEQGNNRGVNFGLGNIQKVKDDDAFGNRTKPQDDFQPVAGATNAQANFNQVGQPEQHGYAPNPGFTNGQDFGGQPAAPQQPQQGGVNMFS